MRRTTFVFLFLLTSAPLLLHARPETFRVRYGTTDTEGKYPYVIALLMNSVFRVASGTLISSEWVLTAAHCMEDSVTHIHYANMTEAPMMSDATSYIIKKILHPGYRKGKLMSNDIALCRVEPVPVTKFGKISSVEYMSLTGRVVEYAGYGLTHHGDVTEDRFRALQIGKGIVVPCIKIVGSLGPYLCVAPKCLNKKADAAKGDSGGALFYDGKLVGVVSWGDDVTPIGWYTPVSPYITWIQDVITTVNGRRKSIKHGKRRKY